eukprot:CAMPEP_0182548374 /NCGR_PEP_ID=MMETSP1323-20130603/38735_1 /TAXON_ID=236787 /ORGANISM="Florenciella parvula, Strain RCC1693" /LENGTH=59 /DNA_ID=CAMNT_0024759765 /DNA_START=374 /DNA_END=549 /DNA_ORIENTATION=-
MSDVARLAPPRGAGGRMGAALAFMIMGVKRAWDGHMTPSHGSLHQPPPGPRWMEKKRAG